MANGVKVATAYVEVNADTESAAENLKKTIAKAGEDAGSAASKAVADRINSGIDEVGKRGRQTFDTLSKNIRSSMDSAGSAIANSGLKRGLDSISESARNIKRGMDTVDQSILSTKGTIERFGASAQNAITRVEEMGNSVSKVMSGDTQTKISGIADLMGQLSENSKMFGDHLGPVSGALANLETGAQTVQGLVQQFETMNSTLGKTPSLIKNISIAMLALQTVRDIVPGQGSAWDRMMSELRGERPFSPKDFANALVPGTNYLDRIFGNSGGDQGAIKTPEMGSGGGSFLPDLLGNLGGGSGGSRRPGLGNFAGASATPSGAPTAGSGVERWRPVFSNVLDRLGLPQEPWLSLGLQQMQTESSGDPTAQNNWDINAVNGTPSKGLMQVIGPTFDSYKSPLFPDNINDPSANIAAAILYTQSRYGGPQGVWGRGVGYDTGGEVPDDVRAQLHAGEHVLTADDVSSLGGQQGVYALRNMIDGGSGPAKPPDGAGGSQGDQNALADGLMRTMGYLPAAGSAGGVAGTSSLARLFGLGNEVTSGLIDTGASAAEMAINLGIQAAAAGGSFGAGAAAGPAASMAASYGVQLAATEAKRAASYGWQLGAIWSDAAVEQLFPFGAPRWIGYDYTQFLPQLNISQIGTTTVEKAIQQAGGAGAQALKQAGAGPYPDAGGPVSPALLPGMQVPGAPVPQFGAGQPSAPPTPSAGAGGGTGPAPGGPGGWMAPPAPKPAAPAPPPQAPGPLDFVPKDILGMDDGGWWPTGTMAFNSTGRSEFVLSPDHIDSMRAGPPVSGGSGDTYFQIKGSEPNEIAREIYARQRLAALQYTGRPPGL
ncbi:lytic transglycosylase domain-containing protein [Mycobacterium marinum]|uniref:lytic transglycosylase domain-containing protein n=1 Tax=Mycobacterium marinum TaxID=1781 RepID=UPI000B973C4F|nr:transglycosylase SLT domain-containing protein [Mycobacterium marinum]